jgi:hypothetical protein
MPLAEAVKYVAAAYGAVLVGFAAYLIVAGRRLARLQRDLRSLEDEVARREGQAPRPGPEA